MRAAKSRFLTAKQGLRVGRNAAGHQGYFFVGDHSGELALVSHYIWVMTKRF